MSLKELAENLGIDEEDFRELVQLFIDTTLSDLDKLLESINEEDYNKAKDAAHSIRGAAGNLGFMDIWESASACEKAASDEVKQLIIEKTDEMSNLLKNIGKLI